MKSILFEIKAIGGDKRTRTADICLARAALYQLSYTPAPRMGHSCFDRTFSLKMKKSTKILFYTFLSKIKK